MTKADREKIRRTLLELPTIPNRRLARIFDCEPKEVGEIPEREVDEDKEDDI